MVRVVAGTAGGLRLKTNDSVETRPTLDRVKEAMFSMISPYLASATVLDLFAGNGGLGIEALSRGAKRAVFNDQSKLCCSIIRENLRHTHLAERSEVITMDYRKALEELMRRKERYTIVLLDPPYGKGLLAASCLELSQRKLIGPGGIVLAEHSVEEELPTELGALHLDRSKHYGKVGLSLYKVEE